MKTRIATKVVCWAALICFSLASQGLATLTATLAHNIKNGAETYDAETFHEILNAQSGSSEVKQLSNRKHKKSTNPLKVYSEQFVREGVSSADLSGAAEIILSSIIEDKAAELDNDPKKMLEWVKFNVVNEFHYGSMKNSKKVLTNMSGSVREQATLLITLLRISGIAARYAEGNITMDIEDLMAWTSCETPEAAVSLLRDNGTPTSVIYKFDSITKVIFEHVWVSALLGKKWVTMDPSFKTYEKIDGVCTYNVGEGRANDIISTMVTDSEEPGVFSVNFNGIDEALDDIAAEIEADYGDLTIDEIFGERRIIVKEESKIASYLPKGVKGYKNPSLEYTELPSNIKFKIRIQFLTYGGTPYGSSYTANISEVVDKKISIEHIPATNLDEVIIEEAGNIYNVYPAYSVKMIPSLRINDERIFTGNSVVLGSTSQWVRTSIFDPAVGYWSSTDKPIESGSDYTIVASQQKASVGEMNSLCDQLESDAKAADPDIDKLYNDILQIGGKLFHLLVDKFMTPVTKSLNIINTGHVSVAYLCNELEPVDYTYYGYEKVNRGGVHLDVTRSVNYPVSTIGSADDEFTWMQTSSTVGSSMENTTLEIMYNKGAVSTSRIFHETAIQGGTVYLLGDRTATTYEEDMATLLAMNADVVVKNHIYNYITYPFADYDVLVPAIETETLGYWKGQGWRIVNRATGASSMMIYGNLQEQGDVLNMLNGAMLVYPNGEEGMTEEELLIAALKAAKKVKAIGEISVIACTMAMAGGAKMVAATKIMADITATGAIIGATPFVMVGQVLGMAFVAAAAVTFVFLVCNYVMAFIIPRRERCVCV